MSSTYDTIGSPGQIWRPVYTDGVDSATKYPCQMGLARNRYAYPVEGTLVGQKSVLTMPKDYLIASGWPYGAPQEGDKALVDGQTVLVKHVTEQGFPDERFYYCQVDG